MIPCMFIVHCVVEDVNWFDKTGMKTFLTVQHTVEAPTIDECKEKVRMHYDKMNSSQEGEYLRLKSIHVVEHIS